MPRSRPAALLCYLAASFGWLVVMAVWASIIGPYAGPRCQGSASFGFLPAAMVVPFAALVLFAFSVIAHAIFAFRQRKYESSMPQFTDAAFFIPFTAISVALLAAVMRWDLSLRCLALTIVLALPWLATPWLSKRLLGWSKA